MATLFYTTADEDYEFLIPLYIYFSLKNNPDAYVEIGVENAKKFRREYSKTINILKNNFGKRFSLKTVNYENKNPGVVRFITVPDLISEVDIDYVYIGDIDILILEKVKKRHIKNMSQNDASFSNIIRSKMATEGNNYRLSGLHFAPVDIQYPLPDIEDLDYSNKNSVRGADEHILYKIMDKKGHMISRDMNYRPIHGIHMRTGHHPFGRRPGWKPSKFSFEKLDIGEQTVGWDGIENQNYRDKFLKTLQEDSFQELYFTLDIKAKNMLLILENVCRNNFSNFEEDIYIYVCKDYLNRHLIRKKISQTIIGEMYRKILNK